MQLIVGGVGNRAAEEDGNWDLKPRHGSHGERRPCGFGGEEGGPCGFGVLLLPRGLGSRRDFARKKRGERILAGGP